ncbi:hypothetical protein Tco_0549171 [Tanacetum coccineum]
MGLWYSKDSGFELIAYSDADHAGCNDDCKITSRGIQFLGDKLVSWSSKKQHCTAMSTAEAKYVSLSACCAQVIWMRMQLLDYGFRYNKIPMYCDSKSAISISCNPVQHSRTQHINIRYHFIKEHVEKDTIELYFVETEYQLADMFTKALPRERFEYLVHKIGIGRCNNYVVLQSIPCTPECKIVGKFLLDHPLSYALTATANVPAVYLQKFWQTVHKVPDTKDTIRFKLNTQEITYTVDIRLVIKDFMNNVFQKKNVIKYPRFIKLKITDLMDKYPSIPQRHAEDYHSIKDDTPLETDIQEKNENQAKNDKTELGMEKRESRSQRPKSQSQGQPRQIQQSKSKPKPKKC